MTVTRIGLACPVLSERASMLDWLSAAGYAPVPMLDADAVSRELDGQGFEALIADHEVIRDPEAPRFLRALGTNRPLIIIGDDDREAKSDATRRNATFIARPVQRGVMLLAVSLALAEGRPARRSPRRPVSRIPATIDGVPSHILDVSYEGIRLEVPEQHRTLLPPMFTVRVPMFRVSVVAKRVWVNTPNPNSKAVWCGAALRKSVESTTEAWRTFVDHAPSTGAIMSL